MSFWPLCCKKPQAYPIDPDFDGLRQQFCVEYEAATPAAGRPGGAESLSVAGARSGRVVTNPIKFRSLCDVAGVSEDGKLYCWQGPFVTAMRYQNSIATPVERDTLQQLFDLAPQGEHSGLYQVGDDDDWDSVVCKAEGAYGILAKKADGSLWAFNGAQHGVQAAWSSFLESDLSAKAFRAKLSSSIKSIKTDDNSVSLLYSRFAQPAWFTAEPQSVSIQKVRFQQTSQFTSFADVSVADSEPGDGASVVPRLRAKIDVGAILNVSVTSGGSGQIGTTKTVTLTGSDGSGTGATADAIVSNGSIASVVVTRPGEGYKHPVTATVSGGATLSVSPPRKILVTSGGSGYTASPSVSFQPAEGEYEDAGGATARVSKMSRCGVGAFEVQAGGTGYTAATAVESRTGATATAVVNGVGSIVSWNLTSAGAAAYSPLDEEPLEVTITGDGQGAAASAVPAGSSVEEVEVVENPEVWSRPPLVVFSGGGGEGAAAVVEGVIGRLEFEVQSGGSGYTKTSLALGSNLFSERTHYAPCVTVPASQDVIGGRRMGGSVIIGEAMLSPSSIASVDQDPAEFCNPYRSPYRFNGGVMTTPDGVTAPEGSLFGHHLQVAKLNVASQGVAQPFRRRFSLFSVLAESLPTEQDAREMVEQTIVAYLRGPGHSRHPLTVEYVEGTRASPVITISLVTPYASPQPPALCIEFSARPHRDSPQGAWFGLPMQGLYTYLAFAEKPNAKAWWSRRGASYSRSTRPFFQPGAIELNADGGAYHRYRIVDGEPLSEHDTPVPWVDEPTGVEVSSPEEYLGPVEERTLEDPCRSWWQPSDSQRIHFFFPTEQGVPARGLAEAIYDASLQHPVIGSVSLSEPGSGYTEEPEALLFIYNDPFPVSTGLTECTSAGFSGDTALAVSQGSLKWWGANSAIGASGSGGVYDPEPAAQEGAAAAYAWRLANAGSNAGSTFVTAKPTLVGGHLSFAASGDLTAPTENGGSGAPAVGFMRLPRPPHGNRLPSFDDVFHPWPSAVVDGTGNSLGSRPYVPMLPGVQTSTGNGLLYRHMPWQTRAVDHGFGYEGSASIQYVGPGLAPHTLSVAASVVANGITRVSRSGLLKHSSGKWFSPFFRSSQRGSWTPLPRTVVTTGSTPSPFNSVTTVTVTDGSPIETRDYVVVARTAGQGYRVAGPSLAWEEFGGSHISVRFASGQGYTFLWTGEGQEVEYAIDVAPSQESDLGPFFATSFGGFRQSESAIFYGRVTPPQVISVNGGGQGAIAEVVEYSDPRSPFTPYCFDTLSDTVDPVGGLAVDTSGRLRAVRGGWLFEPEAFKDFPVVTGVERVPEVFARLQYPHSDCGTANYVVRDIDGRLWGIRMSNDASSTNITASGVFLLSTSFGFAFNQITAEPHVPVALSPLAASLTNTGDGYDYPVKVEVSQPTNVAQGTATIDGKVVGVAVVEGGSGYRTPPTVAFAGGGIAAAEAEIAGPVQSVEVTSGGSGYRLPPKVRFSTPGVPAQATATMQDGQVQSVTISSGGMYRQAPQVFFDPDFDIESIGVTAGGQGYSTPPAVFIEGGATATTQISCSVVRVPLASPGSGYTTTPVVTLSGGGGTGAFAQAILNPADGTIVRIDVISGGTGYTTPPMVTLSGGGGSGAAGYSEIEGFVSSITLGSRGSGYDRAPAVVVSGGGGTGATATATIAAVGSGASATATINGSVVSVRVTDAGSDYQQPPVVSCARAAAAEPGDIDATFKAAILGRPQSVAVQTGGSGYCNPFFSTQLSPGSKRRTPSRQIRRPTVSAKGSFFSRDYEEAAVLSASASSNLPAKHNRSPYLGENLWLNTYPVLGMAQLSGGDDDAGGSVSSVVMPQVVVDLQVTNPGSGYTPFSRVAIRYGGGGTLDNRFRLLNREASTGATVAQAYIGSNGSIVGIVPTAPFGILTDFAAYTSPPTFTLASGNGAVTAVLGHPLQCYYAPQVLFDGAIEMDADMSLTLAGACVDGSGTLPRACCGDAEFPYWVGTVGSTVNRASLLTSVGFLSNPRPDLRLRLVGSVAGFTRRVGVNQFISIGFYSTPPELVVEDEKGSGATISPASLPSSGKATIGWVESCTVTAGGSGYTLGARLRIIGGRPLAWDNPASATAAVSENGQIASLAMQQGGKGYTVPPTVYIVGDGAGATAVVDLDAINQNTGAISAVRLVEPGAGYTSATVVFVDKEATADKSEAIAGIAERYLVLLEGSKIESATVPPDRRRERPTLAVRQALSLVEAGPADSEPAEYGNLLTDMVAAGYKLHGAYLSDGHVEYVRVEHHFGELPPTPTVVTITPTSDVQPSVAATAVATIPACDNVFSGTVANVTTDLPPYQLE